MPKYPHVTVPLKGEDGNAMMIIGRVRRALRDVGAPEDHLDNFSNEAMAGDYGHLLRTVQEWVEVK